MALTDAERQELQGMLERMPDSVLDATGAHARRVLRDLDDLNSAYPETKAFLTARGLTKVSQLDAAGRAELTAHLTDVLRLLRN